jgi:hypothetical protein
MLTVNINAVKYSVNNAKLCMPIIVDITRTVKIFTVYCIIYTGAEKLECDEKFVENINLIYCSQVQLVERLACRYLINLMYFSQVQLVERLACRYLINLMYFSQLYESCVN